MKYAFYTLLEYVAFIAFLLFIIAAVRMPHIGAYDSLALLFGVFISLFTSVFMRDSAFRNKKRVDD